MGHSILQDHKSAVGAGNRATSASAHGGYPPRKRKPITRILLLEGAALDTGHKQIMLPSRKAAALLAYLALTPGMKETRERLVGLLWSEMEPAKARGSLRQLLYCLRNTLDREAVGGLLIDKLCVRLDRAAFTTDLESAFKSIDDGHPIDLVVHELCLADAILLAYDDLDASFHSWLTVTRERLRRQMIARLEGHLCASDRAERTKRFAQALLQVDPTHEVACRQLMCAHLASGNTAAALNVYIQLWDCLDQTFEVEPSPRTQSLFVAIRSGSRSHFTETLSLPDLTSQSMGQLSFLL